MLGCGCFPPASGPRLWALGGVKMNRVPLATQAGIRARPGRGGARPHTRTARPILNRYTVYLLSVPVVLDCSIYDYKKYL